ncbi:hypothetical protein BB561_001835 [Smittium simulii]|uniref:Uncharacterized protein n=1 Tax=Smittium simulii TaxID=133385 RepID=A0A2T9YSY6_9FUNG|nr:hypothetical protein BB561_001835 [Smittium simulii]
MLTEHNSDSQSPETLLGLQPDSTISDYSKKLSVLHSEYLESLNLYKLYFSYNQAISRLSADDIPLNLDSSVESQELYDLQPLISKIHSTSKELVSCNNQGFELSEKLNHIKDQNTNIQKLISEKNISLSLMNSPSTTEYKTERQSIDEINLGLEKDIIKLEKEINSIENSLKIENDKVLEIKKTKDLLKNQIESNRIDKDNSQLELNCFYNSANNKKDWLNRIGIAKNHMNHGSKSITVEIHNDRLNLTLPNKADESKLLLSSTHDQTNIQLSSVRLDGGNDETIAQFSDIAKFSGGDLHSILYRTWNVQNNA